MLDEKEGFMFGWFLSWVSCCVFCLAIFTQCCCCIFFYGPLAIPKRKLFGWFNGFFFVVVQNATQHSQIHKIFKAYIQVGCAIYPVEFLPIYMLRYLRFLLHLGLDFLPLWCVYAPQCNSPFRGFGLLYGLYVPFHNFPGIYDPFFFLKRARAYFIPIQDEYHPILTGFFRMIATYNETTVTCDHLMKISHYCLDESSKKKLVSIFPLLPT